MKQFLLVILTTIISGQSFGQLQKKTETVNFNGIELYYEVYGEGEPLLLLHGWTQSSRFWTEFIPKYAPHFKVYAVDLRGHGNSSPLTSDFTIKKSSNDILALLDHLKIEKAKAIGLSYGGLALLELASSHPDRIESMILIGASHRYNGAENSNIDDSFTFEKLPSSFVNELREIHTHGEDQIKALFDRNLDFQIDLSDDELKAIQSKVLLIQGDRDEMLGIDPAIALYKKLPHSELWIVPNAGHVAITGPNQDQFISKSLQFLTKE